MRTRLLLFIAFTVTSVFGNTQTITIGKQVWSTKNLDVSTFRNGDSIPEAKSIEEWNAYTQAEEPAWCYYENDVSYGIKYGKLYNFYAVADKRGLAPKGFHIPTDKEWKKLAEYLGGEDKAGAKMKSKEGWDENGNGTNSTGFSALPGGVRSQPEDIKFQVEFKGIGKNGGFWSSTIDETTDRPVFYYLFSGNGKLNRANYWRKSISNSVRCIKD